MPATVQRESREFVHVPIFVEGLPLGATAQIEYAVLPPSPAARPTEADWFPAYVLSGKTGILVEPGQYAVGQWAVWYRVKGVPPELPVKPAGKFTVA